MAGVDIQSKVKSGLSKAVKATGPTVELIYKVELTGGGGTPINPIPPVETLVLLVDALFKNYDKGLIDNSLILTGDRQLVSNSDVPMSQGDIVRVGSQDYTVIGVDEKNPVGLPLAYISQVRAL